MGYTHYIYRPAEIEKSAWAKIESDTKKVFEYIESSLGIELADGLGENRPVIDGNQIIFNGSDKQPLGIWTTDEPISIAWPAPGASLNEPNADPIAEKVSGQWFAGELLKQRVAPISNGYGSGSYETAGLDRVVDKSGFIQTDDDGLVFECCKTAYRPYDIAVTAFYTIVKHHVPKTRVSSDGEEEDWLDAMTICHNILGYPMESPLSE